MKLRTLIAIPVLFSVIGAIGLFLLALPNARSFVKWQSMGRPPGGATHVIWPDTVQTASGAIYRYINSYQQECTDTCWVQVVDPTPLLDSKYSSPYPLDNCSDLPSLDGFIDSKATCDWSVPGMVLTVHAVDDKGYVYSWRHKTWPDPLTYGVIGGIAGFFMSVAVVILVLLLTALVWAWRRVHQGDALKRA